MLVNKTENTQVQPVLGYSQRPAKPGIDQSDDLKVDNKYNELVGKALAANDDLSAVEQARKLIESGQLDTPEAADAAAKNIVELGI